MATIAKVVTVRRSFFTRGLMSVSSYYSHPRHREEQPAGAARGGRGRPQSGRERPHLRRRHRRRSVAAEKPAGDLRPPRDGPAVRSGPKLAVLAAGISDYVEESLRRRSAADAAEAVAAVFACQEGKAYSAVATRVLGGSVPPTRREILAGPGVGGWSDGPSQSWWPESVRSRGQGAVRANASSSTGLGRELTVSGQAHSIDQWKALPLSGRTQLSSGIGVGFLIL